MLSYLSRYTHRVAVTFKYKDYRVEGNERYKTMTLDPHEFIRRFLIHVLPKRVHCIRHYGLLANADRKQNIARARELLAVPATKPNAGDANSADTGTAAPLAPSCPCCGGRMIIIEFFARDTTARNRPAKPTQIIRIDTS